MGVPQPGTEGLKHLTMLAVVMAVAAGIGIIRVPRDERIDIGRPLGSMYIKVSKDLTYERRGTSAYAIIRKRYGEGAERKVVRTLQAGITYLPQPPTGWEDATWPVRAAMVANDLLNASTRGGSAVPAGWESSRSHPMTGWRCLISRRSTTPKALPMRTTGGSS